MLTDDLDRDLSYLARLKVESVLDATHLVAGGRGVPLKRTPKLLAGLGKCDFVLDVDWLYQSAKDGELKDGLEHVLCDVEVRCCVFGFRVLSFSGSGLCLHGLVFEGRLVGADSVPLHSMSRRRWRMRLFGVDIL